MDGELTTTQWIGYTGAVITTIISGVIALTLIRNRADSKIYASFIFVLIVVYGVMASLIKANVYLIPLAAAIGAPIALSAVWVMPRYYDRLDKAKQNTERRG